MALITCPECGGTVSDTATACPHCGYQLTPTNAVSTNVNTTVASTTYVNTARNGYDVMLVDYMKGKLFTSNKIAEVIDCTFLEANNLLGNLPCYLYTDLSYSDALYIAQSLQYYGCRIALYDPNGTVTYYAPVGYNKVLPSLLGILRRPIFNVMPPRRHEFVIRRQKMHEEPRNSRPHMSMPMPNQQPRSTMNHRNEPRGTNNMGANQPRGNSMGQAPRNSQGGNKPGGNSHSMGGNNNRSNGGNHSMGGPRGGKGVKGR